jgi:hypothetical protein
MPNAPMGASYTTWRDTSKSRHATIGSIGKIKKVSRYFTSYICHSGMLA